MPDDTQPRLKEFSHFGGFLGMRMVDWGHDHCTLELDLDKHHLNGLGVVHGGVISALIDVACAQSGMYCAVPGNRRSGKTASLTVNFLGAARGQRISVLARRRGGGKTLYMASAEAFDAEGALIALGEAVCRYGPGSADPNGVAPGTEK